MIIDHICDEAPLVAKERGIPLNESLLYLCWISPKGRAPLIAFWNVVIVIHEFHRTLMKLKLVLHLLLVKEKVFLGIVLVRVVNIH